MSSIDWLDEDGCTPLYSAALSGRDVTFYIQCGANVNHVVRRYRNQTPLHAAAQNHRTENVRALIAAGAVVNQPSRNGTPLHLAMYCNRDYETITALLDGGADRDAVDSDGKTAMDIAREKKDFHAIAALLGITPQEAEYGFYNGSRDEAAREASRGFSVASQEASREPSHGEAADFKLPEKIPEEAKCCICFEEQVDTRVLPCGHAVACEKCSEKLRTGQAGENARTHCVYCNTKITSVEKFLRQ